MAASTSHAVSIVYIESNTGDSSGGHAAMKAGRQCFHFQHSNDGILRLERESWDTFRYFYNDLGNRDIHVAQLALSPEDSAKIWRHFTRTLIEQEARLADLHSLEEDVMLLDAMGKPGARFKIKGAGLFWENADTAPASCLKTKIAAQFGSEFLTARIKSLRSELVSFSAGQLDHREADHAELTAYREKLAELAALEILNDCRGLSPGAVIEIPTARGHMGLEEFEKQNLAQWQEKFMQILFSLLESQRPDKGFPLMLAAARCLCIQKSLNRNRLIILNPFSDDMDTVDALEETGDRETLERLAESGRQNFLRIRSWIFSRTQKNEPDWSLFENTAARYAETEACVRGKKRMRIYSGSRIPALKGFVKIPAAVKPGRTDGMLGAAVRRRDTFRASVHHRWSYNLFTRNCVTELLRLMAEALPKQDDPDSTASSIKRGKLLSTSFIPWIMFDRICATIHTSAVEFYPSYRHRHLEAMYMKGSKPAVYFKECNTLTSSIYAHGRQESAFLFFTDDMLPARPLLGALNIAWSLPRAGIGIVAMPFDSGRMLKSGFFGTLFSIPELLFINIRKGDFGWLENSSGNTVP